MPQQAWQTEDGTIFESEIEAIAFMRSYYEKLKAGLGRAEALSSTQKEFRKHRIPIWRHPYVWAAFQLSGDWRPIEL